MKYLFFILVGFAFVILSLCVLIDKLHSNGQEMHFDAKEKKIEICKPKKQIPKKHKRNKY